MFRPKKCMKCGGKPKMQLAGEVQCPPGFKSDGFGNCIPDEPQKINYANNIRPNNNIINLPLQPLVGEDVERPYEYNEPTTGPIYKDRIDEGIARGMISGKKDEDGNEGNARAQYNAIYEEKEKEPQSKLDPYWLFRGFRNGMSWLSGKVERGRQDRYDWMQQTALGQMNPMPTDDFQPNPYNLYMQKGGNLKTIIKDYNKYTNDAQMDMGDGKVDDKGMMQKGGYEIDRMLITRKILPQLLQFGRLGTSKYRRMQGGGTAFWDNIYKNKPLPNYNFGNAPLYLGRQPNWMDSADYRLFFNDAQRLQNLKSPVGATPANYGWDDYKNHKEDTYLDWKLNEAIPYMFINSDKGSEAIRKGDVHNELQGSILTEEAAYKDWLNQKNKVNTQFYLPKYPISKKPKMKAGGVTPNKARQILHDKEVHGKPLTDKQRRYFGAMSKGHTNFRGK